MDLLFEWDQAKAKDNAAKHRVSFDEARTAFDDPLLVTLPDEGHSAEEDRFLSVGTSARGRVLVIVHTDREGRIRIISSRKATPRERRFYEECAL